MSDIVNMEEYKKIRDAIKDVEKNPHTVPALMYRMLLLIDELHDQVQRQGEEIYKLKRRRIKDVT